MLEKNNKFAVFDEIIGNRGRSDLQYVVPQNSITEFRQKGGLCEPQQVNNFHKTAKSCLKCRHCANIAQHLIHLEHLIRSNYKNDLSCNLCNSTLNYLQHANQNIAEIFTKNVCNKASALLSKVNRARRIRKPRSAITACTAVKSSAPLQSLPSMKRLKTTKVNNISKIKNDDLPHSLENTTPKQKQHKRINKKKSLSNGIANVQIMPSFIRRTSGPITHKKTATKKTVRKVKTIKHKYNGK